MMLVAGGNDSICTYTYVSPYAFCDMCTAVDVDLLQAIRQPGPKWDIVVIAGTGGAADKIVNAIQERRAQKEHRSALNSLQRLKKKTFNCCRSALL